MYGYTAINKGKQRPIYPLPAFFWSQAISFSRQDLQAILDRLMAAPPRHPAAFLEQQKYLRLALSSDEKAELSLLAAELESAAIATYIQAQQDEAAAPAGKRQAMAPLLENLAAQMELAGTITQLLTFVDDHQLRGQIRFLKHALERDDDDP